MGDFFPAYRVCTTAVSANVTNVLADSTGGCNTLKKLLRN
jgi:hypothetical protein